MTSVLIRSRRPHKATRPRDARRRATSPPRARAIQPTGAHTHAQHVARHSTRCRRRGRRMFAPKARRRRARPSRASERPFMPHHWPYFRRAMHHAVRAHVRARSFSALDDAQGLRARESERCGVVRRGRGRELPEVQRGVVPRNAARMAHKHRRARMRRGYIRRSIAPRRERRARWHE